MKQVFKMMLYENDQLSYTRIISFTLLLLLVFVTLYLVISDTAWQHYETLAGIAGGGSTATQVANKLINSKYNSAVGSYEQKSDREI